MTVATRRVRSKPRAIRSLAPSEASIQRTCTEWLALDGWRAIVTDPPHMRGLGVTEKGIPDRLYIRYDGRAQIWKDQDKEMGLPFNNSCHVGEILWIEWKKKGGKSALHQLAWHAKERVRGALIWVAGVDFPASIEGFQKFYRNHHLRRKI